MYDGGNRVERTSDLYSKGIIHRNVESLFSQYKYMMEEI